MIRHIVFFTAKDEDGIDQILEGLSVLTSIPHARRLEVARNRKSDQLGNEIDVVVYGEFDSEAELDAYKTHDLYREAIRCVRPVRELRFAADYELSTDVHFAGTGGLSQVAQRRRPGGRD
ncbi:Dabb family protein [Bradyrhizobium sp. CCBAU 51753]|uniref:Dabb family protein n=1 Tax=Bradyrhizobium sp. CCBAU 51753 TaxID=1325100 RepID=UPI00188C11AC|nr:Dabb family protein [Bradyrhizobium sp. CCBAU 51753]QOZ23781.1 Dabb family protein [Bradyrhizobium sp. CCBAU 51753]